MSWTVPTPEPVDFALVGADRPMLTGYLAWQRATLLNICAGLSADQLATRALPSSTLSLLGLVRHLAKVERVWLRVRAAREDIALQFPLGDDREFHDLDPARARAEVAALQDEWRHADAAAAPLDFDHAVEVHGEAFSLRMVYVHLVGEYARHNGHADLLREAIDGVTGR